MTAQSGLDPEAGEDPAIEDEPDSDNAKQQQKFAHKHLSEYIELNIYEFAGKGKARCNAAPGLVVQRQIDRVWQRAQLLAAVTATQLPPVTACKALSSAQW